MNDECGRRYHDSIENPRPGVLWHMRTIGYRARCRCGWVGPDRVYTMVYTPKDEPLMSRHWFDTEKSDKAATLDRTRHLGKLKPRPSASPKDMQRQKLYRAEKVAFTGKGWSANEVIGDGSIAASQAWLDEVLAQPWFVERWGKRKVRIIAGSGLNAQYRGRIMLSNYGRKPWIVLHELAHVLASPPDVQAHGREYAGVYVFLAEHALGKAAGKALRAAFTEGKVKYRGSNLIPEVRTAKAA